MFYSDAFFLLQAVCRHALLRIVQSLALFVIPPEVIRVGDWSPFTIYIDVIIIRAFVITILSTKNTKFEKTQCSEI